MRWGDKKSVSELMASAVQAFQEFQNGQEQCILDMWPAQELFKCVDEPTSVDWLDRWKNAGGKIISGRMIALKNDPIWIRISEFGLPYPPFDKYDLMWVRDVDRELAEQLGIISTKQSIPSQPRDWSQDKKLLL